MKHLRKNDLIDLLQKIEGNPEVFQIDLTDDGDGDSHVGVKPLQRRYVGIDTIQDVEGENQRQVILIAHENRLWDEYLDIKEQLQN